MPTTGPVTDGVGPTAPTAPTGPATLGTAPAAPVPGPSGTATGESASAAPTPAPSAPAETSGAAPEAGAASGPDVSRALSLAAARRAAAEARAAAEDLSAGVGRSVDRVRDAITDRFEGWAADPLVPARDLGVPLLVVVLFGAYLVAVRWLDRGGLPMALGSEPRGDDVHLDL